MSSSVLEIGRRRVIVAGTAAVAGALLGGGEARARPRQGGGEVEVPPTEDLMREHGVLRRVLLVYREVLRRLDAREEVDPAAVAAGATIIREFIEDYHEKSEEEELFPRMRKAGKLAQLCDVLQAQHEAGRRLTAATLKLATREGLAADGTRRQLADALRGFVRMYEPHAAREDTELFPAFRSLLGERELHRLQELFEEREDKLPHGGFEQTVAAVAKIEQGLGLHDLAAFTPA